MVKKLFIDSVRAVHYHPAIKDNEELQKKLVHLLAKKLCIRKSMSISMPLHKIWS